MLDDDERMSAAVIAKRNGVKRYEVGGPLLYENYTWPTRYHTLSNVVRIIRRCWLGHMTRKTVPDMTYIMCRVGR